MSKESPLRRAIDRHNGRITAIAGDDLEVGDGILLDQSQYGMSISGFGLDPEEVAMACQNIPLIIWQESCARAGGDPEQTVSLAMRSAFSTGLRLGLLAADEAAKDRAGEGA